MTRLAFALLLLLPAVAPAQLRMGPRLSPGGIEVLDAPVGTPPATASDVLAAPASRTAAPSDVLTAPITPVARGGQQHWVSLGLTTLQPFTARLGVKVWDRPNGSLWLEAYGGSELFEWMYGFGARAQYTVKEFAGGDQMLVSPGVGVHILPSQRTLERREYYYDGYYYYGTHDVYKRTTASFLAVDVDISWLHDFSPHFGVEFGFKLGLAFRLSGRVDDNFDFFPNTMFNSNFYPLVSFFYGVRF